MGWIERIHICLSFLTNDLNSVDQHVFISVLNILSFTGIPFLRFVNELATIIVIIIIILILCKDIVIRCRMGIHQSSDAVGFTRELSSENMMLIRSVIGR